MSTLRISDAPLLPDVDGTEKIPTGGRGDYAISVDQIKDHIFQDVGKELVGLGNVDNTSDLDKPVSTAQQAALDLKADKTYVDTNLDLKADKTNVYTRTETTLALSQKADLVNGTVPSNQLPSYVDDVVEYTTNTLPIVGESGKIYITTDTNRTWRWSGNQYVEISNGGVSDSTLKLQTPRKIANVDFDGTQDIDIPHNNLKDRDVVGAHPANAILDAGGENQQEVNDFGGAKWRNKAGGYALGATVKLDNGDIVKSTVANNTVNPNVDMTGWENPKTIQQSFNDKYSKFKQPELGAVEQDLSVRAKNEQFITDYSTPQQAFAVKRNGATFLDIPNGNYTVSGQLPLNGVYTVKGQGDQSVLNFSGAGNGIVYTAGSKYDDHGRTTLKDLRIKGDNTQWAYTSARNGTTTGMVMDSTGHFSQVESVTFEGHATGLKYKDNYTSRLSYVHLRGNKVGLHLDGVTSFRGESIYARYQSDTAILLTGALQNITLSGGALEGNIGRAIWVKDVPAGSNVQLHLDDVYMEVNGNEAAYVPSVDIQQLDKMEVIVTGGSYWYNQNQGIYSGAYKWGNSVSFKGTSLAGFHYAKYVSFDNVLHVPRMNTTAGTVSSRALGLTSPATLRKYKPLSFGAGVFQVPFLNGIPSTVMASTNTAKTVYPYIVQSSGVTVAEDIASDYGEGSFQKLTFSLSGSYSVNYAELFETASNTAKPYKVFVFLLKAETDCEVGMIGVDSTTRDISYFKFLAGQTYKIVRLLSDNSATTERFRMFSIQDTPCTLSFKPLAALRFAERDVCNKFVDSLC